MDCIISPKKHGRKRKFSPNFYPLASVKRKVKEVDVILEKTIRHGTTQSLILCGPPGSGKSAILNEALAPYVSGKNGRHDIYDHFQCLRINGAVHTDLTECVDAILSQLAGKRAVRASGKLCGSAAKKQQELVKALADFSSQTTKKAVIFIVDRLEAFLNPGGQMLLYALFESTRSLPRLPTCVVGMSSVLNVLERMESRVRSRFSERVISVGDDLFTDVQQFQAAVQFHLKRMLQAHSFGNEETDALVSDPAYLRLVSEVYEVRKDWLIIDEFVSLVWTHQKPGERSLPKPADLCQKMARFLFPDVIATSLRALNHLQLVVLLCCFQLTETQHEASFSCCMILEQYRTAVRLKHLAALRFTDHWFQNGFFQLADEGLLHLNGTRTRKDPKRFWLFSLEITLSQLRAAYTPRHVAGLPTQLAEWFKEHCKGYFI